MNHFKHTLLIICFVLLAIDVNAQTRLRTLGARPHMISSSDIISKPEREAYMEVFGNSYYPGFIEDNGLGGFYVDQMNNNIVFTDCRKGEQRIVPISDKFLYALNEMFNMVVSTSSPQNRHTNLAFDWPYRYFVYDNEIAVCVYDKGYPSWVELISICDNICEKCRKEENPESDELNARIARITADYKNPFYFEFWREGNGNLMCIGDGFDYLYLRLEISPDININYDNDTCKNILEQVASYLLHNSDGPINCNIMMNKEKKPNEGIEDINITPDEFSAERLIEICRQILCS